MECKPDHTVIRISRKNYEELRKKGHTPESFDEIRQKMSSYEVDYSMEDIEKIMKVLTKHSLEDPECTHSFAEIMQETFEHGR